MIIIKRCGTTLIELLVVIFIILLMIGVASLATRRSQYRTELKNAAAELKDVVDATRQYAMAPRFQAPKGTAGYCFSIDPSKNTWDIKEYVPTDAAPDKATLGGCGGGMTSISQGVLSKRIIIQSSEPTTGGFPTYGWSAVPAGNLISGQPVNITLEHDAVSDTRQISIQPSGQAEVLL